MAAAFTIVLNMMRQNHIKTLYYLREVYSFNIDALLDVEIDLKSKLAYNRTELKHNLAGLSNVVQSGGNQHFQHIKMKFDEVEFALSVPCTHKLMSEAKIY